MPRRRNKISIECTTVQISQSNKKKKLLYNRKIIAGGNRFSRVQLRSK
jgi:hypothetical protein